MSATSRDSRPRDVSVIELTAEPAPSSRDYARPRSSPRIYVITSAEFERSSSCREKLVDASVECHGLVEGYWCMFMEAT